MGASVSPAVLRARSRALTPRLRQSAWPGADASRSSRQSADRVRSSRASADHHRMMSQQERAERVRAQKVVEDQQREIKHMEAELANARQQLDGQNGHPPDTMQHTSARSASVEGDWTVVLATGAHAGLSYTISIHVDTLGRVTGSGVLPKQAYGSRTCDSHTMDVSGTFLEPELTFTLLWQPRERGQSTITCSVVDHNQMSGRVLTGAGAGARVMIRRDEHMTKLTGTATSAVFRPGDPVECHSSFDGGWVDQLVVSAVTKEGKLVLDHDTSRFHDAFDPTKALWSGRGVGGCFGIVESERVRHAASSSFE